MTRLEMARARRVATALRRRDRRNQRGGRYNRAEVRKIMRAVWSLPALKRAGEESREQLNDPFYPF